jgi:hypothetical protein
MLPARFSGSRQAKSKINKKDYRKYYNPPTHLKSPKHLIAATATNWTEALKHPCDRVNAMP